eukprot:CAMPEP_0201567662 /NCGR_PEP_ID=MMETSP0190_2-20130828/8257_1 /ASSEMBLY_ACC=CAM_ASM_000263 /TAXON_ID=37353 /ORGANISM="Rosalina sp." /LENGTH=282 /DNA_ID=CAMNT_0047987913 /DNA_START=26 /DNA_END=874 /DNA_ORIENTATION=+
MSSRRSKQEQEAAEGFHKDKCCTTKWITCGIVWLFVGFVLMIAGIGIYYAEDLEDFAGSQFQEACYVRADRTPCTSETCSDRGECSQNTYIVTPDDDSTCAVGECPEWENGCISIEFVEDCTKQAEYEDGATVDCYAYADASDCKNGNGGRLDPNGEWSNAYTSFVALVVIGVLLIVLAIVFFIIGCIRCMCKKVDDDILGETSGTGCYWCGDYERCCYGEGTGHATIVNQQDKNLPIKDKKRKKKRSMDGDSNGTKKKKNYNKQKSRDRDDYDDEEEAELR